MEISQRVYQRLFYFLGMAGLGYAALMTDTSPKGNFRAGHFGFVLGHKVRDSARTYEFYGPDSLALPGASFVKNYQEFEAWGLRPLYEAAQPGDTLVKKAGEDTISLRGKNGVRSFVPKFD